MSVKKRILQIVESQQITKEKFFSELGYSSGNFRGKNLKKQVGSDALVNIVTEYDVSAHWLLTGEGSMYRKSDGVSEDAAEYGPKDKSEIVNVLMSMIRSKEKVIHEKIEQIGYLKRENDELRARLSNAGSSQVV